MHASADATYLLKVIQAISAKGFSIYAISIQVRRDPSFSH